MQSCALVTFISLLVALNGAGGLLWLLIEWGLTLGAAVVGAGSVRIRRTRPLIE